MPFVTVMSAPGFFLKYCSFLNVIHIIVNISRCCQQLTKLKAYVILSEHRAEVTHSQNKATKNNSFKSMETMTTKNRLRCTIIITVLDI